MDLRCRLSILADSAGERVVDRAGGTGMSSSISSEDCDSVCCESDAVEGDGDLEEGECCLPLELKDGSGPYLGLVMYGLEPSSSSSS